MCVQMTVLGYHLPQDGGNCRGCDQAPRAARCNANAAGAAGCGPWRCALPVLCSQVCEAWRADVNGRAVYYSAQ